MSSSNAQDIFNIEIFREAMKLLNKSKTMADKERWLERVKQHIKLFRHYSKLSNHGQRVKIQSKLSRLNLFKVQLENSIKHVGGGVQEKRSDRVRWEEMNTAFDSRIRTGVILNLTHRDIQNFFKDSLLLLKIRIKNILKKLNAVKINFVFSGEFIKKVNGVEDCIDVKYFSTKNRVIDLGTNIDEWFALVKDEIFKKLEEFQERDSGWALHAILTLEVNINKFEISGGSSYIRLPEPIERKKACINVKNYNDNYCFLYSILAGMHPASRDVDRVGKYSNFLNKFNINGIEFPMQLSSMDKFEKLNNLSVNVYALKKNKYFTVVPARISKNIVKDHFNLLLIQNHYVDENDLSIEDVNVRYHYVFIKDLSRLVSNQTNKHGKKLFLCNRCLCYFSSDVRLKEHESLCSKKDPCRIEFPKDRSHIEFKNFHYKQEAPFVIFADFEASLKKINDQPQANTIKYQEHLPNSAGFYLYCSYNPSISRYESFTGPNCIDWFCDRLENISLGLSETIKTVVPMSDFPNFNPAICHICEKSFTPGDEEIVRDHCHFTGKFRGYAHNACNLKYRKSFVIPVIFHNLSGYDAHFIIPKLSKSGEGRVEILPNNREKYISFSRYYGDIKFRFIDSFRFMGSPLDELASYLTPDQFVELRRANVHLGDETKLNLLTRKGVFPYDYLDDDRRLSETSLPPKENFYNKLKDFDITDEDYEHAKNIWTTFECKTLGDYLSLYLKTDILLLTDVFMQFRRSCLNVYGLDPCWYYSLPGYTWDCMLKYTKCNLQILKDINMILLIEEGLRGGICVASKRYSKANNKYLPDFDPSKEESYLLYEDANNLYGWAMSQFLPYGGFEWCDTHIDVTEVPDDSSVGYILEVDLEYPPELHDSHADLPFCCESRPPPGGKLPKLLTTLCDKKNYVIHYRCLKQALKNGLKLTKIHRTLKFNQSSWLKVYIDLNTKLRQNAKNEFEKNLFKLMNNAVFGKTMENIRKHRVVKLVHAWEGRYSAKNLIGSPLFKNRTIIANDLVLIEMAKRDLIFDKPLYIGQTILDLSKTLMYDFHYDYMRSSFRDFSLCYMDTDSFVYEIRNEDPYSVIKRDCSQVFDTSDYPVDNVFGIPQVNKKVLGLMKDENNGSPMLEFIAIRAKMYSFRVASKTIKKAKGVKKHIVKNKITFDDYKACLMENCSMIVGQNNIVSQSHRLFSVRQNKVALQNFDDKRCILEDGINTIPWGHYSLN